MKYHINKRGQIAKCVAIFRPCPLPGGHHFEDKDAAESFLKEWDDNKINFEDVANLEITDPSKGMMLMKDFPEVDKLKGENGEPVNLEDFDEYTRIFLNKPGAPREGMKASFNYALEGGAVQQKYLSRSADMLGNEEIFKMVKYLRLMATSRNSIIHRTMDEKRSALKEIMYDAMYEKFGDEALPLLGYNVKPVLYNRTKLLLVSKKKKKDLFDSF